MTKIKIKQLKKWLQHKKDSVQRRILFVFLSLLCHLMVVIFLHLAVLMTHQPSPETKTSIQFEIESVLTKNKQNQFEVIRQSHQSRMQWELGPFKGIFPLPFVQLNDRWLMKHWTELMKDQHQGFQEHQINKLIE